VYWHCSLSMRSRVYETVQRPSVRPSVCLSHRSNAAAAYCCSARRGGDIDRLLHGAPAAYAGSVTLTADVGSWTQGMLKNRTNSMSLVHCLAAGQSCPWVGLTHGLDWVELGWSTTGKVLKIWKDYLNAFEARLDKIWLHQAVKFDFAADLTGTGNR